MKREKSRYFLTGLLVLLPIVSTVYLCVSLFNLLDNILGKFVDRYTMFQWGIKVPGLGILVFIIFVSVTGFFATNFIGRKVLMFFEGFWLKFPVVKKIYPSVKQIVKFLFASKHHAQLQKVVLVEYPKRGIYSIGFVTNHAEKEIQEKLGKELLNILIPSVPSPFTGVFILVPRKDVIFLDIGIEEAMKVFVSGGVLNPRDVVNQTTTHPLGG
jgi:uncharacterized membrane protein